MDCARVRWRDGVTSPQHAVSSDFGRHGAVRAASPGNVENSHVRTLKRGRVRTSLPCKFSVERVLRSVKPGAVVPNVGRYGGCVGEPDRRTAPHGRPHRSRDWRAVGHSRCRSARPPFTVFDVEIVPDPVALDRHPRRASMRTCVRGGVACVRWRSLSPTQCHVQGPRRGHRAPATRTWRPPRRPATSESCTRRGADGRFQRVALACGVLCPPEYSGSRSARRRSDERVSGASCRTAPRDDLATVRLRSASRSGRRRGRAPRAHDETCGRNSPRRSSVRQRALAPQVQPS